MNEQAPEEEIAAVRRDLAALEVERRRLVDRLDQLQTAERKPTTSEPVKPTVTNASSATEKVALFRRLFGGRTDVFPVRWDNPKSGKSGYAPACSNEWIKGVCGKPQVKCGECPNQAFIAVSAEVIEGHLRGEDRVRPNRRNTGFVAGVYPLLFDDTCQFLAVDFDKRDRSVDALAFMDACRQFEIPCGLERSRSGKGGHVWLLFSEPVPATDARRLGTLLLTWTMNRRRRRATSIQSTSAALPPNRRRSRARTSATLPIHPTKCTPSRTACSWHSTMIVRRTTKKSKELKMLTHPTEQRLVDLGLTGMAKALEEQRRLPDVAALGFEERLGLLVDREAVSRENKRLGSRLKFAGLRQEAVVEDVDMKAPRGLDKALFAKLVLGDWINQQQNLIIIGPTGHDSYCSSLDLLKVPALFDLGCQMAGA